MKNLKVKLNTKEKIMVDKFKIWLYHNSYKFWLSVDVLMFVLVLTKIGYSFIN